MHKKEKGERIFMAKFNEEICNELCQYREEGLDMKYCADLAGIHRNTLTNWINKGKKAKSGKYHDFFLRWKRATAKYIRLHQNHIAESNSWLAHQYLLQVTDPELYVVAEKQEMEAKVSADANVNADVDLTSPEFMNRELELMKKIIRDKE